MSFTTVDLDISVAGCENVVYTCDVDYPLADLLVCLEYQPEFEDVKLCQHIGVPRVEEIGPKVDGRSLIEVHIQVSGTMYPVIHIHEREYSGKDYDFYSLKLKDVQPKEEIVGSIGMHITHVYEAPELSVDEKHGRIHNFISAMNMSSNNTMSNNIDNNSIDKSIDNNNNNSESDTEHSESEPLPSLDEMLDRIDKYNNDIAELKDTEVYDSDDDEFYETNAEDLRIIAEIYKRGLAKQQELEQLDSTTDNKEDRIKARVEMLRNNIMSKKNANKATVNTANIPSKAWTLRVRTAEKVAQVQIASTSTVEELYNETAILFNQQKHQFVLHCQHPHLKLDNMTKKLHSIEGMGDRATLQLLMK